MSSASLSLRIWAIRCDEVAGLGQISISGLGNTALHAQATTAPRRYSRSASIDRRARARARGGGSARPRRRAGGSPTTRSPICGIRTTSASPPSGVPGRGAHRDPGEARTRSGVVPRLRARPSWSAPSSSTSSPPPAAAQLLAACRPCTTGPAGRPRSGTARAPDRTSRAPGASRGARARPTRPAPRGAAGSPVGTSSTRVEPELPRRLAREQQVAEMRRVAERAEDADDRLDAPSSPRPRSATHEQRDVADRAPRRRRGSPARRSARSTPRSSSIGLERAPRRWTSSGSMPRCQLVEARRRGTRPPRAAAGSRRRRRPGR